MLDKYQRLSDQKKLDLQSENDVSQDNKIIEEGQTPEDKPELENPLAQNE